VPKVDFKGDLFRPEKSIKSQFKPIKKALRKPNFKVRACKLDFPALHESNFAAYFTGCQILGPEYSVKVNLRGPKVAKKSILAQKSI